MPATSQTPTPIAGSRRSPRIQGMSDDAPREREDLCALGQASRPWDFLPRAFAALRRDATPAAHDPDRSVLQLLIAANLALLGLRTAAIETIEALRAEMRVAQTPQGLASEVDALEQAAIALPDDAYTPAQRTSRARRSLDQLRSALPDLAALLGATFDAWAQRAENERWFRTREGVLVRQRLDGAGVFEWTRFADLARQATGVVRTDQAAAHEPNAVQVDPARPVYVLGCDPPALIERLCRLLLPEADQWWTPICIVEPDVDALLNGLAAANLAALLTQDRTRVFAGPGAFEAFAHHLHDRDSCQIPGTTLVSDPARQSDAATLNDILENAAHAQASEVKQLRERLVEHAERSAQGPPSAKLRSLAERLRQHIDHGPEIREPIRVLVKTTRYTSYVQHAASDAVDALRAIGCDARLLIEPDTSSKLTSLALLREIDAFDPDAVIMINYTRSIISRDLPRDIPLITWVQDPMLHLFTPDAWAVRAHCDVVYGHIYKEFSERLGLPSTHLRRGFVPASERKFHDTPINAAQRDAFACDMMMVTNHAQTPESFTDQLVSDAVHAPDRAKAADLVHATAHHVRQVMARTRTADAPVIPALGDACRAAASEVSMPQDDATTARILDQLAMPLADRMLRHQAAHWAAELAQERGLSFRIYGRGWDQHPTLRQHAAGELAHGEDLRAAYQASGATLHVALAGHHHQRVAECALSGGLPIARRLPDTIITLRQHTAGVVSRDRTPTHCSVAYKVPAVFAADHPASMRLVSQLQRLGLPASANVVHSQSANDPEVASRLMHQDSAWLMGDLDHTTFDSRQTLGTVLEQSLGSQDVRNALSRGIAGRVRSHMSTAAAVRQMLALLKDVSTHTLPETIQPSAAPRAKSGGAR